MTTPFNDASMTYLMDEHRYVLVPQYVTDKLGIGLQARLRTLTDVLPALAQDRFLDMISRHVYGYIYRNIPTANRNFIEYVLAKCEEARPIIRQAMLNEVEYAISDGDFWNRSGVNLAKGGAMDLSTLRDNRVISYDTECLLYSPIPSLPYPILYKGVIPQPFCFAWRKDY